MSAIGFKGVSEPDDIEDVEEGDMRDGFVESPNGMLVMVAVVEAGSDALDKRCPAGWPRRFREYDSKRETSGGPALPPAAARCCAAAGP